MKIHYGERNAVGETTVKEIVQYPYLLRYSLDGHRRISGGVVVAAHSQHDFDIGGAVSVVGFVWL